MKKKHIYMSDLHFEHVTWKKELEFQKDELSFFRRRLEEVVPRYTKQEVLARAEQFQNQMIRHNEVIDIMLHDINAHEHKLSTFAQEHPIASDHVYFEDHGGLREKQEVQRKLYAELKRNFLRYLTETM